MITKDALKSMKEKRLREHLIALYQRMGFKEIDHYHGPQELGKDILMSRIEDGRKTNYAVLVKAGNISGVLPKRCGN